MLFFVVVGNKRKFTGYVLVALLAVGLLIGGIFTTGRAIVTSSSSKLVPVYRVAREDKVVSITLDATWGDDHTLQLLDLFDKHGIKVTFFLAGNWIKSYPDMVKEISNRGHEIGNHSLTHPHMSQISTEQMKKELLDTENLSADDIYARVMGKFSGGDIILFHNAGKNTLEALERIITDLKAQGYQIVPVSEILLKGDTYTDKATGEQRLSNPANRG